MLLGPVPQNFTFLPKHKANAYSWTSSMWHELWNFEFSGLSQNSSCACAVSVAVKPRALSCEILPGNFYRSREVYFSLIPTVVRSVCSYLLRPHRRLTLSTRSAEIRRTQNIMSVSELACVYSALILHDADISITVRRCWLIKVNSPRIPTLPGYQWPGSSRCTRKLKGMGLGIIGLLCRSMATLPLP